MEEIFYFDHCASTPLHPKAQKAMLTYIERNTPANAGAYHHINGGKAAKKIKESRAALAAAYNVAEDGLVFTSGATEGNNIVIQSFARSHQGQAARIIINPTEHPCALQAAALAAKHYGTKIIKLRCLPGGPIDLDSLADELAAAGQEPTLVCVMHINNEMPFREPLEEISRLCRTHGAAWHCDAVQGVVREQLDMQRLGATSVVTSAHKVGGPQGLGLLLSNRKDERFKLTSLMGGGQQEYGLRPGTSNNLAIIGATAAFLEHEASRPRLLKHMQQCDEIFVEEMSKSLGQFTLNHKLDPAVPGIVSFRIAGVDSTDVVSVNPNVCLSRGAVCSSGKDASHVPMAAGLSFTEAMEVVRAGFGLGCSVDQVRRGAADLCKALKAKDGLLKGA